MLGAIVAFTLLGAFLLIPLVAVARHVRRETCRAVGTAFTTCTIGWSGFGFQCGRCGHRQTPLERAAVFYVRGDMTLAEFEAVAENYLAGHDCCPQCGRFPVNGDGLCERHRV